MKGRVSVIKVDTDEYPKLASRYNVKVRGSACTDLTLGCCCCLPGKAAAFT